MESWISTIKPLDCLTFISIIPDDLDFYIPENFDAIKGKECKVLSIHSNMVCVDICSSLVHKEVFVEYWKYFLTNKLKEKYPILPDNVVKLAVDNANPIHYNYSFDLSICNMFVWSKSKQGNPYWSRVDAFCNNTIHYLVPKDKQELYSEEVYNKIAYEQLKAGNAINFEPYYIGSFPNKGFDGFDFSNTEDGYQYWDNIRKDVIMKLKNETSSLIVSNKDMFTSTTIISNTPANTLVNTPIYIKSKTKKNKLSYINKIKSIF